LKILWVSDSPFSPSAYGQQTLMTTPLLHSLGHEVVVLVASHHGRPLSFEGVRMIGGYWDGHGNDIIASAAEEEKADCVITLKDPYCYDPASMRSLNVPWYPIVPVDTEPLSDTNRVALEPCTRPIAVTQQGADALKEAGFDPWYVPHGINCEVFAPGDKQEARQQLKLPVDPFIALFVGDNRTDPSRKGIDQLLHAWSRFIQTHPDAILYMHTDFLPVRGGIDLQWLVSALNIPKINIFAANQYQYISGFSQEHMARLYQAADVLIGPSLGEGFWLPGLEAQACGTPVLGTQWAAQREMIWAGVTISSEPQHNAGERVMGWRGGFYFRPSQHAIYTMLKLMADGPKPTVDIPAVARRGALRYHLPYVVEKYWKPVLNEMEQWNAGKF
jgi:glycosyltransferase involved in cell wall biosynthesis